MNFKEGIIFRFALKASGLMATLMNHTNGTLNTGGVSRTYLLHVPASYDSASPAPLVISLHGLAEWPAHQMQVSHWNEHADRHGFIVVYPCGTEAPLRWHAFGQTGDDPALIQDVAFISDLIDKLSREYALDPARIFVNGLSNGGGMAFVLSGFLSERIAAFGSVSGAYRFAWNEYQPARTVPAIIFHGTRDPIVPYAGTASGPSGWVLPSIPTWVAELARRNGCASEPLKLPPIGRVEGLRYTKCASAAEVYFYTIHGGGHSWPGGGSLPRIIAGTTNRDIDATAIMWDFFQSHPLK